MSGEELRAQMGRAFGALGTESGRLFAGAVRGDDAEAPPCWGDIATAFEACFASDEDRLAGLELLLKAGDRHALMLFADAYAKRPRVLAALLTAAPQLSAPLQRVVVAVARREGALLGEGMSAPLHPAARELARADADTLARELALVAGRVGALRAMRIRAASQGPSQG